MDIPDYMATKEIRSVTIDDKYICMISDYVMHGWPSMRAEVQIGLQPYGHSEMKL